jgi:hypothetical protein
MVVLSFSSNEPELGLAMHRDGHISITPQMGQQSQESKPKIL